MTELGLRDFYSASSSSAASVQSSRVDMSEQQRKDCMNELLHKAEGDKLPTGTQAELAQKYGVSRWTIYRIWKSVKKSLTQRQQLRPSNNYKGNVGRKRIAVSEQEIMELPLRKRCNIRSLASALKIMELDATNIDHDSQEEYVLLDLDAVCGQVDIPPGEPYVFSGLDTANPVLTIGDKLKLIGEYEETVGTCLIFTENGKAPLIHKETGASDENLFKAACITDPNQEPSKQIKPVTTLHKILKFRLFLEGDLQDNRETT